MPVPHKQFIYLIQSAAVMPYDELPHADNDFLLLTWKLPSHEKNALYWPGCTWNQGRNRLLAEALRRSRKKGCDYLYYIFMDDDCIVEENTALANEQNLPLTGNPFRTFEQCLLKWNPAVGYTRYDWQHYEQGCEVNLGYNFDAIFNAFHHEAVPFLLPYYTGFDTESWLYSQHLINHLTAMLYNPYRLQFNLLTTRNVQRRSYTIRKKYWTIPTTFLMNAVTSDLVKRIRVSKPNSIEPIPAKPRKKDRTYRLSEHFFHRNFDTAHPFIKHRRPYKITPPPKRISTTKPKTAVCITGHCRTLKRTWENIRDNLLVPLGNYDLFMYVPEDEYSNRAHFLNPTVVKAVPDRYLDESGLINGTHYRLKSGLQAYLQQLYGLKHCDALRHAFAKKHGVRYQRVIRSRPDLLFMQPVADIDELDLNYIHVPDFHQYDGLNDRFAIGSAANMAIYMNKFDSFCDYAHNWLKQNPDGLPISAEMFTGGHLREHGIETRLISVRFNRVRKDKIKRDVT